MSVVGELLLPLYPRLFFREGSNYFFIGLRRHHAK